MINCEQVLATTHPMMIFRDATSRGASGYACSQTRGHRSNSEIPSSSRACLPDGHAGHVLAADLCCRWDSGTGRDRGGWLPREDEGCAGSSTFSRKCCMQTVDGSPATPSIDTAQMMSAENLEVMPAAGQSEQNTHVFPIEGSN